MRVAEIFESYHGECNGHHQGRLVTFIRLSGCNLNCDYCDTPETKSVLGGKPMDWTQIAEEVNSFHNKYVCITGGEPLIQKSELLVLLRTLWNYNYKISVETNGTIDITPFFRFVESFVVDYKLKVPKTIQRITTNYTHLRKTDVIKFVVKNIEELIQASFIKDKFEDQTKAVIAFSPIMPDMTPATLSELLKKNKIRNAVLSVQLHKIIGFK